MAAAKKHALDLFKEVLPALDIQDLSYYAGLSDEKKKGFAPLVCLQAMSGVHPSRDLAIQRAMMLMTNSIANQYVFPLVKHPELQWMVLASSGLGMKLKHHWIDVSRKAPINPIVRFLRELDESIRDDDAETLSKTLSIEDLLELAEEYGWQEKQLKALARDLRKG